MDRMKRHEEEKADLIGTMANVMHATLNGGSPPFNNTVKEYKKPNYYSNKGNTEYVRKN